MIRVSFWYRFQTIEITILSVVKCPHLLTVFSKFCNLFHCPLKRVSAEHRFDCTITSGNHCTVWCLSHSVLPERNSLPGVLSSSCEIATNCHTIWQEMCLPWRLVHSNVYISTNNFFSLFFHHWKDIFSCASTMTSLHDSLSSTYESLLIVTFSQFLGDCYYWPTVSCSLFFCQALFFRVFMIEWCSYKWTDSKSSMKLSIRNWANC